MKPATRRLRCGDPDCVFKAEVGFVEAELKALRSGVEAEIERLRQTAHHSRALDDWARECGRDSLASTYRGQANSSESTADRLSALLSLDKGESDGE